MSLPLTKCPKEYIGVRYTQDNDYCTYNGKPLYELDVKILFELTQAHLDTGYAMNTELCQNALGLFEQIPGCQPHVYDRTTILEFDDVCIQGWNSKPMIRVKDIQDGGGKGMPGQYALNPRPGNQARGKRKGDKPSEVLPMSEISKLYELGKLPTSIPAFCRVTGLDEDHAESCMDLLKHTTGEITQARETLARHLSPCRNREQPKIKRITRL